MRFWTWTLVIVLGVAAALMAFSLWVPIDESHRTGMAAALAFTVATLVVAYMCTLDWGGI